MRQERAALMGMLLTVSALGCQPQSDLIYDSLQGVPMERAGSSDNGIYQSKEDFLSRSQNPLPLSILLGRGEGWVVQIAYGSGWVPGAFFINVNGSEDVCVPESDEKMDAYQRLFSDFKAGQKANRSLVQAIRKGEQPFLLLFL